MLAAALSSTSGFSVVGLALEVEDDSFKALTSARAVTWTHMLGYLCGLARADLAAAKLPEASSGVNPTYISLGCGSHCGAVVCSARCAYMSPHL